MHYSGAKLHFFLHSTKYFDAKTLKNHIFTPKIRKTSKSNQLNFSNNTKSRT